MFAIDGQAGRLQQDQPIEVLPCNQSAVNLFLGCRSQWSQWSTGLIYEGVKTVIDMYYGDLEQRQRAELFKRLQVMEFAVLKQ